MGKPDDDQIPVDSCARRRQPPAATPEPTAGIQVAIVSGLSGAGRSTAAKCLEDLGWFVVDNLPPELITTMVDLGSQDQR